jgi:hypothetical protein
MMDTETGARPDPIAATALQQEIDAALKRIEMGLAQASSGIATLHGPLSAMANLLLVTRAGKPAIGDQEQPQAEETVPEDQGRLGNKDTLSVDPEVPLFKIERRVRALEEQEPRPTEETGQGKEDQYQSTVVLDGAAKERLSKIEERLRSLEG